MSKMKEIEQVAEFMATTADALEAVVSKTIEILYKQNTNATG
jgi:hypothetical protein